jgi:hypothetical protein
VEAVTTGATAGSLVRALGLATIAIAGRLLIHAIRLASAKPRMNGITRELIAFWEVGATRGFQAEEVVSEPAVP